MFKIFAAVLFAAAFASVGYSQDPKPAELARLSGELGDRDYRIREEAGTRFLALGADALPSLRKLALSGDPEAVERTGALIAKIEKRIDLVKETAGKFVELEAKEQTLGLALASLRKQTGYALILVGDQKPLSMTVTPKGGKSLFWDTLEELTTAAGLIVEPDPINNPALQGTGIEALARPDTFVLRKRTTETANPSCVSGAFRIEAIPGTLAFAQQIPSDRSAAILQICPEPRCRWEGTTEVFLGKARDQDDRSLSLDFVSPDPPIAFGFGGQFGNGGGFGAGGFGAGGGFGNLGNQFGISGSSVHLKASQAPLKFQRHPAGPSRSLKTLEGIVRGRIWGQPEPLLTIAKLHGNFQEITGANGLTMKAKVEPLHGEPNSLSLWVTVGYETSVTPTAVWDGLTIFDGAGKTMTLHTLRTQTENLNPNDPFRRWTSVRLTAQYAVRPAKPGDKLDPQKLTFSGGRVKSVDIPFRLKDVPLIRGTAEVAVRVETDVHSSK